MRAPKRSNSRLNQTVAAIILFLPAIAVACSDSQHVPTATPSAINPTPAVAGTVVPSATPGQDVGGEPGVGGAGVSPVVPFTNVAAEALKGGVNHERQKYQVWNDRPGVAIFDFDRDGDLDFYLTADGRHNNWLYRNDGDGTFTDVAEQAGVTATDSFSTGVVACDIDNDGYQDLYVGAWGDPEDLLGFRSPSEEQGNRDSLFLNNGDGTFRDITATAFGDAVNLRSSVDIACADVDGNGWVDLYVGNLMANDFRVFGEPGHAGHYNVLYRNNGDLTFTDITEAAGVKGPQILMRDPDGRPILFEDPETGEQYEGYDPGVTDRLGNRVGEPTGQTHAVLFFDYDDDRDPDIWVANDGDRLHLYRNDSTPGNIRFTAVERAIGIDKVGAWMGFAVGDYDSDADLDVFVTNIGFHPLLQPPKTSPRGACDYHMRFEWGTCLHFLLRNDGTRQVDGLGPVGDFKNVAPSTAVVPSPWMPPLSLDPSNINPEQEVTTGLAAYDFGFGTTFFDADNDGNQDLYWLGSTVARGEAPGGKIFPGAGRMLRGDGRGSFEDITVRARLLNIVGVDYDGLEEESLPPDAEMLTKRRIDPFLHENGKGLAHGDLDGDGYVDLIGTNSSGEQFNKPFIVTVPTQPVPGPTFVWMNGGGENHWITIRLQGRMAVDGTGSNADGIGARVYVKTSSGSADGPKIQVREVIAGSSYLSMDSLDLEFGLGSATMVDEVLIMWPSGRTQTVGDLEVDRVINITEPEQ
ncbi:MAG: CRTAC1 family protein [SAR202 cluster bacterium]|nr:CRTAC1 family protein [SAR202 cluster bacterium]